MKYGSFLKKGDCIGLVAPSVGIAIEPYKSRFENACKKFKELGFRLKFCNSIFQCVNMRSNTAEIRAKEFMDMYLDDEVDMIFSVAGGEFMIEILPFIDFELLKKSKPKYFQGYSDNTNLTFLLTTLCDISSIYFECFPDFGMIEWHKSLKDNFDFLNGKDIELTSYDKYEISSLKRNEGMELSGYNLTEDNSWKILSPHNCINIKGRVIGGCLDILSLICGTKFDKVKEFNEKYADDGLIWYIESCDLNINSQLRAIWQLKNAGWFEKAKCILIGRPIDKTEIFDMNYKDANYLHLKDLNIPVVIDADIGHLPPQIFMLNGAICNLNIENGKAKIIYELK